MKTTLENILAEISAIDKIEIDSMSVMMQVLQQMEGLIESIGPLYQAFEAMPEEQAAEIAPLFEQLQSNMEALQVKIDKIEFN